jgi:acetolactate synthase-1/2/3 large subunit
MGTKLLADREITAAEGIIRVLEENGIDAVFGIPGGNSMLIYDALFDHRNRIRTVLVRHESLAGVMAEVYGRLTGKPGVAIGQGLFMLSNALLGVIEATLGAAPMLILTDTTDGAPFSQHAPYQSGTGEYGTWNARAAFSAVTKLTLESHLPSQAIHHTQMAFVHARCGCPGPVALLYHSLALKGKVKPEAVPRVYTRRPTAEFNPTQADPVSVHRAAKALEAARRPVIIAGNGVRAGRALGRLLRIARRIGAPVATTSAGKGVFPEDHELALGVFGTFGLPYANACIAQADLLLVAGSRLAPSDTAFENKGLIDPLRQSIIQIDVEARNIGISYPCECPLAGDVGAVLQQIRMAWSYERA